MSTKSKSKKAVKVFPFTKQNATAFGKMIYNDEKGVVSFIKLCEGTLKNGKDGGRTLHCAVGEAVATFVDPTLKSVYTRTNQLQKEREDDDGPQELIMSQYLTDEDLRFIGDGWEDDSTMVAIDKLVEAAQLKSKSPQAKHRLAQALLQCVTDNDEEIGSDNFYERSRSVAETWKTRVLPLLK